METKEFDEKTWWAWFLCHSSEAVESITKAPEFNPKELKIEFKVNGVPVLSDPFDKLMDHLVALGVEEKLRERGFNSVREAAHQEARTLMLTIDGKLEDEVDQLVDKMRQIKDSMNGIITTYYDAPFIIQAASGLSNLMASATIVDDKKEKYQSVSANIDFAPTSESGHGNISATAYGATEGEARVELERMLYKLVGIRPETK